MNKLSVDVWSDIAYPWCHVGKRRLEAALARFPHRVEVEVTWRAFELDPSAPAVRPPQPYAERLAAKYRRSVAQAQAMGLGDAAKERFLTAYLSEGEAIGDHPTLSRLAVEVGLDEAEVRATLAGDAYAADVRAEEMEARELGITGVPFFVIGRRYAISGAQSAEVILGALEQAWGELAPPVAYAEGAACGPDGCA